MNSLFEISKSKTTIIVTHRISSAKNADKIIVLEDGKIIQEGTHDTLVNSEGFYQNMYLNQLTKKK